MPQSAIPAAAGHTQATGGATNEACLGALLEAEQALIREQFLFEEILPVCHGVTPHALADSPPACTAPQSPLCGAVQA